MLNRSKTWAWALLLAAFVAGAAVGGAASAAWGDRRAAKGGEGARRPSYVERMQQELNLTAAQHESVTAILQRYQPATQAIWEQMRPRFDSLRGDLRAQIARVLDDDQREKYRAMVARSDSNRARRAGGTRGQ